jgi:hypothetical protein
VKNGEREKGALAMSPSSNSTLEWAGFGCRAPATDVAKRSKPLERLGKSA